MNLPVAPVVAAGAVAAIEVVVDGRATVAARRSGGAAAHGVFPVVLGALVLVVQVPVVVVVDARPSARPRGRARTAVVVGVLDIAGFVAVLDIVALARGVLCAVIVVLDAGHRR